jgi:hypothetical protein
MVNGRLVPAGRPAGQAAQPGRSRWQGVSVVAELGCAMQLVDMGAGQV